MRVLRGLLSAATTAALVVACGSSTASPTVRPEFAWSRAEIELPSDVVDLAPGSSGGMICSPCHAAQASLMTGVTSTAGGLLAVGLQLPPSSAIAYRSTDGRAWTPEPGFPAEEDSAALSVAADAEREVVVGRRGTAGAAWVKPAARSAWQAAPDGPSLEPPPGGTAELRTATTWHGRIVAAGSRDADADTRSAAAWTSSDGLAWDLAGQGDMFDGAAAYGVAGSDERLVVVGETTADAVGHAVAWVSDDATAWRRIETSAFEAGTMRAVAWTGTSFVAVGYATADDRAMAWTSADGETWTAQPTAPSLENHGKAIRLLAVAAGGGTLLGAGWKSDAGNGSGVVWTSADGVAWERLPDQVSMSGASLSGASLGASVPVVVGTSGYPDNDQASAWFEEP
jgi:hypothetical protein